MNTEFKDQYSNIKRVIRISQAGQNFSHERLSQKNSDKKGTSPRFNHEANLGSITLKQRKKPNKKAFSTTGVHEFLEFVKENQQILGDNKEGYRIGLGMHRHDSDRELDEMVDKMTWDIKKKAQEVVQETTNFLMKSKEMKTIKEG